MKIYFIFLVFLVNGTLLKSQTQNQDVLLWNKARTLQEADFLIKTDDKQNPIASSVVISMQLRGFSVFNKNFNKNVVNHFVRNASVINPAAENVLDLVEYQQLQFDLAEIYARKLRKELFLKKNTLLKGFAAATEIQNAVLAELYEKQMVLNRSTNYGTDSEKVKQYRTITNRQLHLTDQYDYSNTAKIDVSKDKSAFQDTFL